jgi:hypothetical protein
MRCSLFQFSILFLPFVVASFAVAGSLEVRTYMPFSFPIDPAQIQITPERKLSYALATTLVVWDDGKGIAVGLANHWKAESHGICSCERFRRIQRDSARFDII